MLFVRYDRNDSRSELVVQLNGVDLGTRIQSPRGRNTWRVREKLDQDRTLGREVDILGEVAGRF